MGIDVILKEGRMSEMSEKQPRGTASLALLQLLKRHTDENHTLSQSKIKEILYSEYEMNVDRKTIRRNLLRLMEYGFPIQFKGKDIPEDEMIMTNWYYDHAFTKGELWLLIDNIMFTAALPKKYRKDLIAKLERLSSKYFSFEMPRIDMEINDRVQNNDIIMTYENIGYAIANGKQLSFFYCDYKADGKLYPRTHTDGSKKQYIVNPYQLFSMNEHPYLICNLPKYDI